MQITIIHPKNELCRFIIRILGFVGIDASENKYLVETEVYENAGISKFVISPKFGKYFAEFYGKLVSSSSDKTNTIKVN